MVDGTAHVSGLAIYLARVTGAGVSACGPRESNRSRGRSSSGHETMPHGLVEPVDMG
jgi:hypothetical protein